MPNDKFALQKKGDGGKWSTVETGEYTGWMEDLVKSDTTYDPGESYRCVDVESLAVVSIWDGENWHEVSAPAPRHYAFICDAGCSGLPQHLEIRATPEEIVAVAKERLLAECNEDAANTTPEDEEWSFWVDTTPVGSFDKLGYFTNLEELESFFSKRGF